jgi:hypothetical protein
MKTLVLFVIAALTLTAAVPAVAKCYGCGANGTLLNGIWSNGVWGNGVYYQGSSMQGSTMQGTSMQGSRTHGAEVIIGSATLVKIELPR